MVLEAECHDLLDSLVRNKAAQDEVARALTKYLSSTDIDTSQTLTPHEIISAFISQFSASLKPDDAQYLNGLLDVSHTEAEDLVVVHELHPSTEDPHDITSFLADGGIGRVWLARDQQVQREVVLKQLLPGLQDNDGAKSRFVHEAQVTGSLQHPNIVPVYSMNWDVDQSPFYTMKYIRGDTLAKRLDEYHLSASDPSVDIQTLLERFSAICQAIAYAHDNGIIHRDIKPENIAIGEFGEVTVLDWGLAEPLHAETGTVKTTGVLGTPNYMPPEQAIGNSETGPYSDIYSLGAILYEILCGTPPRHPERQSNGLTSLLTSIVEGDIPRAINNCPAHLKGLAYISDRCLHVDPMQRYPNVAALIEDIRAWSSDLPITAKPDNRLQSFVRKLRHNRRTVLASMVLLPVISFVLTVFVTNYNIEYSNLQAAKRNEVAKQDEYLETKQRLAVAIKDSSVAKEEADRNTKLANQNRELASNNREKYLREQQGAVLAREEHLLATKSANLAAQKAIASTKAKAEAKLLADKNRQTAESLAKEIKRQIFDSLNRNAKQDLMSRHPQGALAWTSLALQHATAGQLEEVTVRQQRLRYNVLKSHIPQLQSLKSDHTAETLLVVDPFLEFIQLAIHSKDKTTLERRSTQTLQTKWVQQIDAKVIGHCISTSADIYCVVTTLNEDSSRVLFFNSRTGALIRDGVLPVKLNVPQSMYLTDNRLIFIQSNSFRIFNRDTLDLENEPPETQQPIYNSALSPDGSHLATLHGQYELRLWDTQEGLLLTQPINPRRSIASFQFQAPSGQLQVALGNGQQVVVDSDQFIAKARLQRTLPLSAGEAITSSVFHSHQLFTAYGTSFGRLLISNASGSLTVAPVQLNDSVTDIQLSNDNRVLVIRTGRFTLHAYDIQQRKFLCRNLDHPAAIEHCLISPDNRFVTAFLASSEFRKWDLATPSFAPIQISNDTTYLHAQNLKNLILAVTADGQIELRQAERPFGLIASKTYPSSLGPPPVFVPNKHGCFLIEDKQLCFLRPEGKDIQIDSQTLYATANSFAVHADTGTLAIAHPDRTLSIFSPTARQDQQYNRLEGFVLPYESVEWVSPSELAGLVYDHEENTTKLERFSVSDPTPLASQTFPGVDYQFLRDANGRLALTDSQGNVFTQGENGRYDDSRPLAATLKSRSQRNPTIAFLENGLVQRISDGAPWEFQSMFPDLTTKLSVDGHFALATDNQITVYNTNQHAPITPPLFVPQPIHAIDIYRQEESFHLIAATSAGLYLYDLSASDSPASDIAIETLALTGTLISDEHAVSRRPQESITASLSLPAPDSERTASPLGWLKTHSSRIDRSYWEPLAKELASRQDTLSKLTSQQATKLIDQTVQAQLGARQFKAAVSTLQEGYQSSRQYRHLYQACVLAAWLDNIPLYHQTLQQLHNHVDLAVPQQFVDFSAASAILPHQLELEDLNAVYERLKNTSTSNPIVLRALLLNAWRLDDSESVQRYFKSLLSSRASIPIRNFCATIILLNAADKAATPSAIRPLTHNHRLTNSMEDGNPGTNWAERCLADIALRRLLNDVEVEQ